MGITLQFEKIVDINLQFEKIIGVGDYLPHTPKEINMMNKEKFTDNLNVNPCHYKSGGIELIDVIKAELTPEEFKGFCKAIILKYICRADKKNGVEDYEKAKWYMDELVEYLKELKEEN